MVILPLGNPISFLSNLAAFTAPKPDGLSIFLELGNQGITMFHNVGVLLVLVIRSVGLDDTIDAVNCAGNAVAGNELGQITKVESQSNESLVIGEGNEKANQEKHTGPDSPQ